MKAPLHQSGFAAIAAIFLVVVLAALGGFMLTFSNTQQLTSAQDLQGTRAYWAARAGLEWGIGSVVVSPGASGTTEAVCPVIATSDAGSTTTQSKTTVGTNFDGGFSVTVNCVRSDYQEAPVTAGTPNRFIYQFTSEASATGALPGSIGYIQRNVSASMECVKNEDVTPVTYSCG